MHGSLQVGVHELEDEVEVPDVLGSVDVQKPDDVRVVTAKKIRQVFHQLVNEERSKAFRTKTHLFKNCSLPF